jgi:hypothetical protein
MEHNYAIQEGNTFGKGRPKGHGNKPKRTIYDIHMKIFELLGGVENYLKWAQKKEDNFYNIFARMEDCQAAMI